MNFGELKAQLRAWLRVDTTRLPDATAGYLINKARRDLSRRHDLRFTETFYDFAITAGTDIYSLPSRFSRPWTMYWRINSNTDLVEPVYVPWPEFAATYHGLTERGAVEHWSYFGSFIYLGAVPSEDVALARLVYYRILVDFSAESDHDDLSDQNPDVIVFRALSDATTHLIEDARHGTFEAEAKRLEGDMLVEHSRARRSARSEQIRIYS
jgi:hypothetical protein